ncbi:MBL fold metallo-hydrolase [Microbacterium sp. NPDC088619]|uniref:MBL fold metallo-hydrolase n=1 Tax=Microbacterium sp. NPDC088619 TaxID=3364196 RepID=UPI00380BEBAD
MTGRLRHYTCGSTSHDVGAMFRGGARGVREFPSGVFLYDAADGRRVLFDTGYATGPWHTGWRGAVYRLLLPPVIRGSDDVAARLRADGVDPASVTHVVLSHLHPDHVGGVRRFPHATFVLSAGHERTLAAPRLRAGVLTGLLPTWFPDAERIVIGEEAFSTVELGGIVLRAHDLLGDSSYLVLDLPGHADGHLGALIERRVLLAGDAAWGNDLIHVSGNLKALPRAVQHDADRYAATARSLGVLAAAGIRVVCSHDPLDAKELLS